MYVTNQSSTTSYIQNGMEKQITVQLMQKFFTRQQEGTPLSILSVVTQEHLKGYIYVEANKEAHVREVA